MRSYRSHRSCRSYSDAYDTAFAWRTSRGFFDRLWGRHVPPGGEPVEEINSAEAEARLAAQPTTQLLDVREPEELDEDGFIPGSVHIPMPEIESRWSELDPARPIIVYCAAGMRSYNVGCYLAGRGFTAVASLRGGLRAWHGEIARRSDGRRT
ncbi:hypothetical protein HS125_21090 [bacterium]|nr:hypothetical protein [bacterium]MBE7561304.1 hypothetical protein [bacterium]